VEPSSHRANHRWRQSSGGKLRATTSLPFFSPELTARLSAEVIVGFLLVMDMRELSMASQPAAARRLPGSKCKIAKLCRFR
jgi:hypothetical protein